MLRRIENKGSSKSSYMNVHSSIIHNKLKGEDNPNVHQQMNGLKNGGIAIMEYYSAMMKRKSILIYAMMYMNPGNIMSVRKPDTEDHL